MDVSVTRRKSRRLDRAQFKVRHYNGLAFQAGAAEVKKYGPSLHSKARRFKSYRVPAGAFSLDPVVQAPVAVLRCSQRPRSS